MFKEIYAYVTTCVACQTRNLKKVRAPMQETPVPPYPFCHIGVDVSGPYPTTMSGNTYIIGFIDCFGPKHLVCLLKLLTMLHIY
jgi:hypothetical protein